MPSDTTTELPEMTAEDHAHHAKLVGDTSPSPALAEQLGAVMLNILATSVGAEAAAGFARQIVTATMPGTPERAAQDKAWSKLENRLIGAQKDAG